MQHMTAVMGDPNQDDLSCPDHKSHCVQESQVKMNVHFPFFFLITKFLCIFNTFLVQTHHILMLDQDGS